MKSDRETFRSVSRGCTSLTSLGLSFLGAKWEHKHLPTGVSRRPCDIMHKVGVPQSQLSLADFTYSYNSGNGYILIKDYKERMCVCV